MNSKNANVTFYNLILSSLMIALIFISANIIKIPTFNGFVHLGDCMVLLSATLLGKKRGALVSAIGMTLVDFYAGYLIWIPFTFLIKGLMAYIAGYIIEKHKNPSFNKYLISFITSGTFMVFAYFLAGAIIVKFFAGNNIDFISSFIYSFKDVLGNIFQVSVGILLALPLSKILIPTIKKVNNY